MKIAIDESGDTGRKFWLGSSRWFVVAAAIVPDTIDGCGMVCQAVTEFQDELFNGQELHFAHNSHEMHEQFFRYMSDKEYVFVAVALDKIRILKSRPHLLASKASLIKACLNELFFEVQPWLDNPTVYLDTNGSRTLNRLLRRHMLKLFGSRHKGDVHAIKDIRYVDSKEEPLVQLADYIAGATRHHVDKKYNSQSFEKYLEHKGKIIYLMNSDQRFDTAIREYNPSKRRPKYRYTR